jgi:putative tryptophan/tyrosine transport system substrate-binding protein
MMRRREFITLVGGAATWPLAAQGQQPTMPVIGFLGSSTAVDMGDWVIAFLNRLHQLGWVENRNLVIEYRWAEGRTERYAEIVAEFVRLKVDVIVTYGTAAAQQAKKATTSIPIVFAGAGDPVGAGLVASLARPGSNTTGLSLQQTDSGPKRLELLREIAPRVARLGIMANVGSLGAVLDRDEARSIANSLGLQTTAFDITRRDDIAPSFGAIKGRVDALYIVTDPMIFTNRRSIHALAVEVRLPTICTYREYATAGCLISYGPSYPDLFRRAAEYVDKILRGTKPDQIPVEQPTRFDLVLNLTTAKAIGLTVPPSLLARADEVLE